MRNGLTQGLLVVVAILLGALLVQPYVNRMWLAPAEPREIAPRADLADLERSSVALFETIAPSVVQVVSVQGRGSGGSGTGFVWDDSGHIVTNNHVVEGATQLALRLSSGDVVPAELIGRAPNYDLAVLRISDRSSPLPAPVPLGSLEQLQVGQIAYAIGNPFGLDQSLSMGVISALKRRLPTSDGREVSNVIQTDAAINPGNSGGPLLDSAGRLIGVTTAIYSPSGANAGIGFAIPVDVVNRVVPELIRSGRVPTPGIGIVAADEGTTAQLGLTGVVIAGIRPGFAADRAGLLPLDPNRGTIGDIIIGVDGQPVQHLSDLVDRLEEVGAGGQVMLRVQRGNQARDVQIDIMDIGER